MSYYSNPTVNRAIGSVDGEIRRIPKLVKQLREKEQRGGSIDKPLAQARRRYVGLLRRVLERELAKPPQEWTTPQGAEQGTLMGNVMLCVKEDWIAWLATPERIATNKNGVYVGLMKEFKRQKRKKTTA